MTVHTTTLLCDAVLYEKADQVPDIDIVQTDFTSDKSCFIYVPAPHVVSLLT